MRIAVVTIGRFHVLDLARELNKLGHDVKFYSCVPKNRFLKFNFPNEKQKNYLFLFAPIIVLNRVMPAILRQYTDLLLQLLYDSFIATILEPCDIFIGMSGLCIKSAMAAKKKFNAKIIIERGSRHILSQKEILEKINTKSGKKIKISSLVVNRELRSYEIADYISVPSMHALQSFIEKRYDREKIFKNIYGVDLKMFKADEIRRKKYQLIFVGTWCYRKGVDILVKALDKIIDINLLHVGSIGDYPFPTSRNFIHFDPIPQARLRELYTKSSISILPSREEGLSLVQLQAIACGLPVICTTRTGGEDLKEIFSNKCLIEVVPPDDVSGLQAAIEKMLKLLEEQNESFSITESDREKISWEAYGERYNKFLLKIIN